MAIPKNQIIDIPLNGSLNMSKNKTKIQPYSGFNNLNSPMYGDMLSPLYMAQRNKDEKGNDRPYIDKEHVLRDSEGNELLNLSNYKGIKRTELKNIPANALAAYDENQYVDVRRNGEGYSTVLHKGDIENATTQVLTGVKANAAAYTESGLIIINSNGKIYLYDQETFNQLATAKSLESVTAEIRTFYDPLNKWQIISVYSPFGDWDYKHVSSFTIETEEWKDWKRSLELKQQEITRLENDAAESQQAYLTLKQTQDDLQQDINNKEINKNSKKSYWDSLKVNFGITAAVNPFFWVTIQLGNEMSEAEKAYNKACTEYEAARARLKEWNEALNSEYLVSNQDAINIAYKAYDTASAPITVAKNEYEIIQNSEPEKYASTTGETLTNPNIYAGKLGRRAKAYNFVYSKATGQLEKINMTIPWDQLVKGSQGPDENSYIFTGIYDSYIPDHAGNYAGGGYVRYRLGVIPYGIGMGTKEQATIPDPKDPEKTILEPKYFFAYNYTPKIHFDNPNTIRLTELEMGYNIPESTKTYISTYRDGFTAIDSEVYFSGSGKGSRESVWGKVSFVNQDTPELAQRKTDLDNKLQEEATDKGDMIAKQSIYEEAKEHYETIESPTVSDREKLNKALNDYNNAVTKYNNTKHDRELIEQDIKDLEAIQVNFNKFNLFHDLGYAKYTMYSPFSAGDNMGNATTNAVEGSRNITKINLNYEVSGDNIYYEAPTAEDEPLVKKDSKNIFREIINNGVISNVSICEDIYHVGTLLETANGIDPKIPVFYKNGKDGDTIVYKTEQEKWIEVKVLDNVEDKITMLGKDYAILPTTKITNCIRLSDKSLHHFAPDWNNRFSLVGSPYNDKQIEPLQLPAINTIESGAKTSDFMFATGINVNYEVTENQIVGYNAAVLRLQSQEANITPIAFVSEYDNIDIYFSDLNRNKNATVPAYYTSFSASDLSYGLFNNIDLVDIDYPDFTANILNLFCKVKPSNFGRYYLDDGSTYYSLNMYNGKVYFVYFTTSLLDDIRELFMVQGQTFAVTRSDYLYSVFIDQYGATTLADSIANVKGLQFCGAVPDMAIFYSPMDRTLKSFTADHILKNIDQATDIAEVYYTTYSPQTSAVYICTNNGIYVYSTLGQYRLPIVNVKEIYFGGYNDIHTYILYEGYEKGTDEEGNEIIVTTDLVNDYVFDKTTGQFDLDENGEELYKIQPIQLETNYYGKGNNLVSVNDCVYLRLYSDDAPFNTELSFTERTITDDVYRTMTKKIQINKSDWDERTKTCYVRYQPRQQRAAGFSLEIKSECAIVNMGISTSSPDTVAISRPKLNA